MEIKHGDDVSILIWHLKANHFMTPNCFDAQGIEGNTQGQSHGFFGSRLDGDSQPILIDSDDEDDDANHSIPAN